MNFSVIDYVFLALIGLFIIRCLFRGFLKEIISLGAIVFGFLGALFFYKNGGEFIRDKFMPDVNVIPELLAFLAIFLAVFLIAFLLKVLLKSSIDKITLFAGLDKMLGFVFGMIEGIVIVSLVLFLLKNQPLFNADFILQESFFAKHLLPLILRFSSEAPANV